MLYHWTKNQMKPSYLFLYLFQHARAHKNPASLNFTFYEIITAGEGSPKIQRELRNRCLNPSMYAQHLERWLDYFPPSQVSLIPPFSLYTFSLYHAKLGMDKTFLQNCSKLNSSILSAKCICLQPNPIIANNNNDMVHWQNV